ncbi:MAG: FecR domain-containing protein [Rikenellaceae bacterium]|nr:FecR domain-containing protein [Rikenellaceae bacterium]
MENRHEIKQQPVPTDAQLDKLIGTLLKIDRMDDRPLYNKIKAVIARKEAARRRKRMWIRTCAAGAAVVILAGTVWFTGGKTDRSVEEESGVRLIVSDGRNYNLSNGDPQEPLFSDGSAVMKAEAGTLFIESDEARAQDAAPVYHTLEVPKGMQYDIVLSDGSRVWLNSDTRLRFPTVFPDQERRVFVEGEAYFEVAQQASRPFIVEMGSHSVTVLGTAFNVNAYWDSPTIRTTLFSGSVKVSGARSDVEEVLIPGQQASVDRATGELWVETVDLADVLAWRVNVIHLEKRTLQEITDYMAKIYDVQFRFMDDSARRIRFRGNVTRSEQLSDVLDRIAEVGNVKFETNGNVIEIGMQ